MTKKILIIEDDEDTSGVLAFIASGINLEVICSDKVLPISEIQTIAPDVILLDHWIGDHLGGDLCLELKAFPTTRDIPVIMLSAHTAIHRIAKACCADAYLSKPFNVDELTAVIEKFVPTHHQLDNH
jgi:DNA-binding response OmpR family regulator